MRVNIRCSTHHHHHHHQAKGVDNAWETAIWQPRTSHTSLARQRVTQRTWRYREKSILSFRCTTGQCAATARWVTGLSKIHTHLAGSKASGPCVFQRKRWGKRFLWHHPCTWQCVVACLCVFTLSLHWLNLPQNQYLSSLIAPNRLRHISVTTAKNFTLSFTNIYVYAQRLSFFLNGTHNSVRAITWHRTSH